MTRAAPSHPAGPRAKRKEHELSTAKPVWIVIIGSVVGNQGDGFHITHNSDLREFGHKPDVISHGFALARSDDFNVGLVRGGRLESLWWMDKNLSEDAETLAEISREIGLQCA